MNNFASLLKKVIKQSDLTQADVAKVMGVTPQAVSGWVRGEGKPKREKLELLASELKTDYDALLRAYLEIEGKQDEAPGATESGYITLPRLNICPSAGAGTITEEEMPVDFVRFKEEWLRSTLQVNPAYLKVLPVDGDSMEPTLRSGDIIVVDCRKPDHIKDGVYVIRHDGALKVKRLQGLGRGAIKITSDNPRYDSITIGPEEPPDEFAVCGRVVWAGRRM